MTLPKQGVKDWNSFFDPRDEPALKRIHFFNGQWDQLNWYVELVAKDLSQFSDGEWIILQEEVVALHRTLSNYTNAKAPSKDALSNFHQEIKRYLTHLRNGGVVKIGPLEVTHEILLVEKSTSKDNSEFSLEQYFNQSVEDAIEVKVRYTSRLPRHNWQSWLLDHFGRLLGKLGASIRRCPKCFKWFLQFRKSSIFCGRLCQNRAGAEAARARNRKGKIAQKPEKIPLKKTTKRR